MDKKLFEIRDAFIKIDKEMRENSICHKCSKPQCAILPAGVTPEQADMCLCEKHEFFYKDSDDNVSML